MRSTFSTAADVIALNEFHRTVRILAGEAHDTGYDDLPELLGKLDGIVAACSELRKRAVGIHMEEQASRDRAEMEVSVPPCGSAW